MFCHICNAKLTDDRLLATTFHFWARCCPACTEKYGERDRAGALVYRTEKKENEKAA